MSDSSNKLSFVDHTGGRQEVTLDVNDYREASDQKLSLSQYYANKFPTGHKSASTFEQFVAAAGIRVKPDTARGIPASSLKEIFHGTLDKSMGTIVRNTGADRQTTAGRLLFPEIMLQLISSVLIESKEDYLKPWENAIAMKSSVVGTRVDQPTINIRNPLDNSAAQPIAQLADPAVMVSISLGDRSYSIPTKSIALEISDQALQSVTIDLLGITLAAQVRGERIRRIEADMAAIISGDVDRGINAVGFQNASAFDSSLGSNKLTHKAYVKWLREHYQKMTITHILGDIDAAFDVDARAGRPQAFYDSSAQNNRIPVDYSIENLGLPSPKLLLLPTSIIGANRLVGFDRAYAFHEITNSSATYSATENFVMRRSQGMRFDYGVALFKFLDEAFTGLTLGA